MFEVLEVILSDLGHHYNGRKSTSSIDKSQKVSGTLYNPMAA